MAPSDGRGMGEPTSPPRLGPAVDTEAVIRRLKESGRRPCSRGEGGRRVPGAELRHACAPPGTPGDTRPGVARGAQTLDAGESLPRWSAGSGSQLTGRDRVGPWRQSQERREAHRAAGAACAAGVGAPVWRSRPRGGDGGEAGLGTSVSVTTGVLEPRGNKQVPKDSSF